MNVYTIDVNVYNGLAVSLSLSVFLFLCLCMSLSVYLCLCLFLSLSLSQVTSAEYSELVNENAGELLFCA